MRCLTFWDSHKLKGVRTTVSLVIRKLSVFAMVALATFALTGSSAFAFFCYNASRAPQGNAGAGASSAQFSLADAIVLFCGVDPGDLPAVLADIEQAGFPSDVVINIRTVMAQGLYRTQNVHLLHNGKGVDHLSEAFFVVVEAAAEAVGGDCE